MCMHIHEGKVIASAVRLDEIPAKYRELKLLGRGATTLAFELDPQTVIIFTRDRIKLEWLRDGIRMVHEYQAINPVRGHHIQGMHKLPLYMVTMPKLYPLNATNRKKVTDEMRNFTKIAQDLTWGPSSRFRDKLLKVISTYDKLYPNSVVLPLLEWITNYDPDQFYLDMGARQFKQTAHGDLVLLDPIITKELMMLLTSKFKSDI